MDEEAVTPDENAASKLLDSIVEEAVTLHAQRSPISKPPRYSLSSTGHSHTLTYEGTDNTFTNVDSSLSISSNEWVPHYSGSDVWTNVRASTEDAISSPASYDKEIIIVDDGSIPLADDARQYASQPVIEVALKALEDHASDEQTDTEITVEQARSIIIAMKGILSAAQRRGSRKHVMPNSIDYATIQTILVAAEKSGIVVVNCDGDELTFEHVATAVRASVGVHNQPGFADSSYDLEDAVPKKDFHMFETTSSNTTSQAEATVTDSFRV